MITHYKSSKGPVAIDAMPLRYANNALAKLRRDAPERVEEIDAIAAHVAKLEAEGDDALAPIGDNGGPPIVEPAEITLASWEAIKAHMDDLLTEAGNWADGVAITSQEQADNVGRVRQLLQDAARLADKARVEEKDPLDKAIAEIQDRYNAYIAPLKNKAPGSISKATAALGNMLTDWLNKLDAEKRAREKVAADAAAKAAAEALAAHVAAQESTDLATIDKAEDLISNAEAMLKQAKGVAKEKVQVQGEYRAIGLRSYWTATLIEADGEKPSGGADALRHYMKVKPDRLLIFLQTLADEDVRNGLRAIPGFNITEERKVA